MDLLGVLLLPESHRPIKHAPEQILMCRVMGGGAVGRAEGIKFSGAYENVGLTGNALVLC